MGKTVHPGRVCSRGRWGFVRQSRQRKIRFGRRPELRRCRSRWPVARQPARSGLRRVLVRPGQDHFRGLPIDAPGKNRVGAFGLARAGQREHGDDRTSRERGAHSMRGIRPSKIPRTQTFSRAGGRARPMGQPRRRDARRGPHRARQGAGISIDRPGNEARQVGTLVRQDAGAGRVRLRVVLRGEAGRSAFSSAHNPPRESESYDPPAEPCAERMACARPRTRGAIRRCWRRTGR